MRFRRTTLIIYLYEWTQLTKKHRQLHVTPPSPPWPRGGGRTAAHSPRRRQPSVWAQTSLLGGWRLRRASCRRWRSSWGRQRPQRSSCPRGSCRQIPQVCTPPLPRHCNWQMPWRGPRSGEREARCEWRFLNLFWEISQIHLNDLAKTIESFPGRRGGAGAGKKPQTLKYAHLHLTCLLRHLWMLWTNLCKLPRGHGSQGLFPSSGP